MPSTIWPFLPAIGKRASLRSGKLRAGPAPHQLQHTGDQALHLHTPVQYSRVDLEGMRVGKLTPLNTYIPCSTRERETCNSPGKTLKLVLVVGVV